MSKNSVSWTPSKERVESSAMFRFMSEQGFSDYASLHQWSVDCPEAFWEAMRQFGDMKFDVPATTILNQPGDMTTATWFDGATLSFPAHLLRHTGSRAAIVFRGENGVRREISFDQLRNSVAACAAALRLCGVEKGDRIGGFLPNCPEAIVAMLAATSVGAIWSSCSPDFGINGVVDRFGQIAPKLLICADGYFYSGKQFDSLQAARGVAEQIESIDKLVVVPFTGDPVELPDEIDSVLWDDFCVDGAELEFLSTEFNHPLYIMYSSGTTGVPKCIVHGVGGTLLQHLKEHMLHCDIDASDRVFFFTTCGWMMWNWLASVLATGATIILFDGSPFAEDGRILWRIAEEEKMTLFGTGAKYISAIEKAGVKPGSEFDLHELKSVMSTGSTLVPESFDYVYDAVTQDVLLASASGGTDIISCFAGGNPLLPVRRGELQCLALGMAVEIFDDNGNAVIGENGELVCTRAFPSMPVGFWDDPQNAKYHAAYFDVYPGVWAHGDYARITADGGMEIFGRSDAVLNPGGVRIGTAEIYRQVEKLDQVLESIAIGQRWDDDVRVVLFVVLRDGVALDNDLLAKIRNVIRENATPRHVPAKILEVDAIPRTISGKIVELAVRNVVHNRPVKNTDALANPEALEYFRDRPELAGN